MTEFTILKEASPLVVLAVVVIVVFKYLRTVLDYMKTRDQQHTDLHNRTTDVIDKNSNAMNEMRSAITENTTATRDLCRTIKNGSGH